MEANKKLLGAWQLTYIILYILRRISNERFALLRRRTSNYQTCFLGNFRITIGVQGIQGYFKNTYKKDVTDVFLTTHVLDNMYPPLKFSKAQKCMKSGWKFRKFEFPALFEALEHNRKSAGNSNFQNSYFIYFLYFRVNFKRTT